MRAKDHAQTAEPGAPSSGFLQILPKYEFCENFAEGVNIREGNSVYFIKGAVFPAIRKERRRDA